VHNQKKNRRIKLQRERRNNIFDNNLDAIQYSVVHLPHIAILEVPSITRNLGVTFEPTFQDHTET